MTNKVLSPYFLFKVPMTFNNSKDIIQTYPHYSQQTSNVNWKLANKLNENWVWNKLIKGFPNKQNRTFDFILNQLTEGKRN